MSDGATPPGIPEAVRVLHGGGVVAHATEGVWGLACDPFDRAAVGRVLTVKKRPESMGLIVIGAGALAFARELSGLGAAAAERVRATWPGATTWVVPNERFPDWVTGGRPGVAVRVPGHAQARALAAAFGGPLVSTSANRSGREPCRSAAAVRDMLGGEIDYLLPGETGGLAGPSRIFDAMSGEALR